MNINKQGGTSQTSSKKLNEYAKIYKRFIAKEIDLINPNLIICCSKLVQNIYNEHIRSIINNVYYKNIKTICVYHPSYFRISDKEYLNNFKNALNKEDT